MSDIHDSGEAGIAEFNKTRMMRAGIFALIAVVLFAVLLLFSLLSRSSWSGGMEELIDGALTEHGLSYQTGEEDVLHSPVSLNCVSYREARESNIHIVLLRVPTLYGPFPALYVYDENSGGVEFVDLLLIDGMSREAVTASSRNMQVQYWQKRIPRIVGGSSKKQGDEK